MPDMNERLKKAKKDAVLRQLRETAVIRHALDVADISRGTLRRWREEDEDFDRDCEDAMEDAVDLAEAVVQERAVRGWRRPIIYQGRPIWARDPRTGDILLDDNFEPVPFMEEVDNSDMLKLYMKGRRKSFATTKSEVSGPGGGPVSHAVAVRFVGSDGEGRPDPLDD